MANELPYFRFTVQAWQNGKIDIERYELKGFFITICGYYWIQDCDLTLSLLQKKFNNDQNLIKELIELGIIKHEKRYDKIEIEFLNIQYDLLSEKRKTRQAAGSKGGNARAMLKQKRSYKDKDNNKDKDNTIPSEFDFLEYCETIKEFNFENYRYALVSKYEAWVSAGWKDGNGKAIKNWKTKIKNTYPYLKQVKQQTEGVSKISKTMTEVNESKEKLKVIFSA